MSNVMKLSDLRSLIETILLEAKTKSLEIHSDRQFDIESYPRALKLIDELAILLAEKGFPAGEDVILKQIKPLLLSKMREIKKSTYKKVDRKAAATKAAATRAKEKLKAKKDEERYNAIYGARDAADSEWAEVEDATLLDAKKPGVGKKATTYFDSRKEDDVTVYLRPDLVIVRTRSLDGTSWENIMPLKLAKLKGLIGNIIARAGDTAIQIPRSPTKHEINPEMYDSNNRRIFRR